MKLKRRRHESNAQFGERASSTAKARGYSYVESELGTLCISCQSCNPQADCTVELRRESTCYNCHQ